MSRKTALELERLAGLRLAGKQWAAERTALPAAKDALRAGARLLESAAQNTAEVVPAPGRIRDVGGAAMESAELIPASALVLTQGTGLAESLREAPAVSGGTLAGIAPADSVSAWSTAEQSPALGRMRDAGGAAAESAELIPAPGLVLTQGAGLAESLREAPAASGRTLAGIAPADSVSAWSTAEQSPALGRMRDAGGAAAESAELIPAPGLVLTQGAGLAESLREAPAASGRTLAGIAPADSVSAWSTAEQSPALGRMRDAGGADVKRSESGLAVAGGAGSGASPALAWGPRAVLPGTGSLAAQTGEEPLSRTAVLNLGDVPAAWASMRQAARKSDFALADTPEQSVRFSAALPENGLPASGEAQLTSLPRPAGKKEKPDGAEKSGENRSAVRRDAQESGTEDFWGLWARRFAGELHSSAEGVHG